MIQEYWENFYLFFFFFYLEESIVIVSGDMNTKLESVGIRNVVDKLRHYQTVTSHEKYLYEIINVATFD